MKIILTCLALLISFNTFAYIKCDNITVNSVQTATGSTFHGMNVDGITGSMIFVYIPSSQCQAMNSEDISKGIYLVVDDINNQEDAIFDLKKYWSSMLLTAKAAGTTIGLHASFRGVSNSGVAVIEPYYLRAD